MRADALDDNLVLHGGRKHKNDSKMAKLKELANQRKIEKKDGKKRKDRSV